MIAGEQSYKFSHSITILNYLETGIDSPDNNVIFYPSSRIAFKHSNHLWLTLPSKTSHENLSSY